MSRAAISAGIAVGIVVSLAVFTSGGAGVFTHTTCAEGGFISDGTFWTPFSLANAPYGGFTTYNASFNTWELLGPTHVNLTGDLSVGNLSTGEFETQNWSVEAQANESTIGPGLNTACSAAYRVVLAHSSYTSTDFGIRLQGPGNTSNVNEPTSFLGPGGSSLTFPAATFANGFADANLPAITTCGSPGRFLNFSSTSFDVSISLQTSHGPSPFVFPIPSIENYTYHFPLNGGTWQVDNLQQNSGLRGPGLAFSWSPC